ncbi:hypothetical protein [Halomontanus rarus]|uniref:hypothetical protein n=1 Tax=Halomontanus rarus TaxID=3034020 RepID=UPI0023E80FFC|nr:hypothetical protein [Halovivax sp. TS33]
MVRWLMNLSGESAVVTLQNAGQVGPIEIQLVRSLGPLAQSVLVLGVTVLLGAVCLGLLPEYGRRVVETTQRSPVISVCIGVPSLAALGSLVYLGSLLAGSSVGVFFAIPLVSVGLAGLVLWTTLGFVALGGVLARRMGFENVSLWILVGGLCSGVTVFYPPVGIAVATLTASLGIGAGIRVVFSSGGVTNPEERVVPPANKI